MLNKELMKAKGLALARRKKIMVTGTLEERTKEAPAVHREISLPAWAKKFELKLTENQKKVIRDKYLRNDSDEKVWLYRVAENVALGELIGKFREEALNGVHHKSIVVPAGEGAESELLLLHAGLNDTKDLDRNHGRFIRNLYRIADNNPSAKMLMEETSRGYFEMMAKSDFLPNSPTLMNAGRELQQLSACYVLPIDDSIDGWGDTVKNTMRIHKSGGGTGFSSCRVRPHGDAVKSTQGVASGAISPLLIINHTTEEIKQGGTRRGANMGILPYWHPDIFDFITAKSVEGRLENFNISVAVDAKFMDAVRNDKEYELINPRNNQPVRSVKAKEVFNNICENAWKTGDPGIIFLDRINNSFSNPTPAIGQIESTNPCGEQPLLPYEPCNLGSINLGNFVKNKNVDYVRLEEIVKRCTRFLDNVIDVNNYPIPEIEHIAKGNRRIGLGVMGWAEMLAQMDIAYDSNDALVLGGEVMKFINKKSLEASEEIATERGLFPNFKDSIYDESGKHHQPWAKGKPRNCARTTIAPTGTIAIAAGLQGGGIEPFFAIAYTRYNAKAIDALKKNIKPDEKDVFDEVNPIFKKVAEENNYFGLKENELWKKIEENHTSVRGIKEIPEHIQRVFATAHDVTVEWHVRHQSAFQAHTDNGVSKTINLSNSATVEDIRKTYLLADELNCKGITVYRDGCKSQQVLNIGGTSSEGNSYEQKIKRAQKLKQALGYKPNERPKALPGIVVKQKVGDFNEYCGITYTSGKLAELFANTNVSNDLELMQGLRIAGLTVSRMLRAGVPVEEIINDFEGVHTGRGGVDKGYSNISLYDAIANSLAMRGFDLTEKDKTTLATHMLDLELLLLESQARCLAKKQGTRVFKQDNGNGAIGLKKPCPNPDCKSTSYELRKVDGSRCMYYDCCWTPSGGCS